MGRLVHHITSESLAKYGVNILEIDPPRGVPTPGNRIVAVVGDFPWGPTDTVTQITSSAELFSTFCPLPFDSLDSYPALKAFIGKRFPSTVKVVRIDATDAVVATKTFEDASSNDSLIVTAKYQGALGNSITVTITANADTATNRDVTIKIGDKYEVTYENAVTASPLAVDATIDDPYVTLALDGSASAVPDAATATALASGADGTAVAGDYLGTTAEGLKLFEAADEAYAVIFFAEPPTGLRDALNAGLKTHQETTERGIGVLCTPDGQTKATAQTYAQTYAFDRLVYPYPRVKTVNTFDPDRATTTVQGNAFVASAIVNTDEWLSPGGKQSADWLRGIVGLESGVVMNLTDYANLNAAGVAPFFKSSAFNGYIIHKAVVTDLTAGKTRVLRRRLTDYIAEGLGDICELFTETPLDVDMAGQRLGPNTSLEASEITAFLQNMWVTNKGIATVDSSPGYTLDFFAGTAPDIDAGRFVISLLVKFIAPQESVILRLQAGETVQIAEAV